MYKNSTYNTQDTPNARMADVYVTLNGERRHLFNAKNCEVTASVENADVPVLGRIVKGKKALGLEIKITMTVYKCTEYFDNVIETFKNTGIMPTMSIFIVNEDPASSIGRSSKTYRDCVMDGDVLLSMFDADGEFIEQDITMYAMDYYSASKYTDPSWMKVLD